jgi:hypothetical protein
MEPRQATLLQSICTSPSTILPFARPSCGLSMLLQHHKRRLPLLSPIQFFKLSWKCSNGETYSSFTVMCGIDCYGNDIGSFQASSFEACLDRFASTSKGVDVSYIDNHCYTKDMTVTSVQNKVWDLRKRRLPPARPYPAPTPPLGHIKDSQCVVVQSIAVVI